MYRYKGILAVKGFRTKYVFQGVHCFINGDFVQEQPWKDGEQRECRFVFIGKNMKQKYEKRLYDDLQELRAEEPLRFKVGDRVLANAGARLGWTECKVLRLWDEGNPYRLEVQNRVKSNIWALTDNDDAVEKL